MEIQDILKYLQIVRKWWWVIALLFVTTVGTMLALALLTETQYEATVTVQVSAPPPQEVPLYSQFGRQALRDEIEQTRSSFKEFLEEGDVPYRVLETLPDIQMRGGELRDRITIDLPDNSQLMRVHVRAPDSKTAALLANTLVETGLKLYGQLLAKPTVNTRKFIEGELEVARQELKSAEDKLTQFQIANKIGNLNSAINSQYDLIRSLQIQRDLARAEGGTIKAQAIEETILEREAELQNLIGLSAEYNELADRVERARTTYNFLLDKRAEAQIKENQILELGSIQIITPARPPKKPVATLNSKLIVLGAVGSLLAGVLLTFLLEYLEISGVFRSFQKRSEESDMIPLTQHAR
ncbi:MAG: hypothetical protein DRG83_12425 [Deltaproteobacteria bacterium]|nr:MAG: hypothetical protein DRG83_12425 [Deltaproteobacteria bacterium]